MEKNFPKFGSAQTGTWNSQQYKELSAIAQ